MKSGFWNSQIHHGKPGKSCRCGGNFKHCICRYTSTPKFVIDSKQSATCCVPDEPKTLHARFMIHVRMLIWARFKFSSWISRIRCLDSHAKCQARVSPQVQAQSRSMAGFSLVGAAVLTVVGGAVAIVVLLLHVKKRAKKTSSDQGLIFLTIKLVYSHL